MEVFEGAQGGREGCLRNGSAQSPWGEVPYEGSCLVWGEISCSKGGWESLAYEVFEFIVLLKREKLLQGAIGKVGVLLPGNSR